MRREVAGDLRAIFESGDRREAALQQAVDKYAQRAPKLSAWMDANVADSFTVFSFRRLIAGDCAHLESHGKNQQRTETVTSAISWSTAGSSESASAAPALPRSAASVYWVKSLVPMLMRSTSGTAARAWSAKAGTSAMAPTSNPGGKLSGAASDLGGGLGEQGAGGSELVDGRDHREEHGDRCCIPPARARGAVA